MASKHLSSMRGRCSAPAAAPGLRKVGRESAPAPTAPAHCGAVWRHTEVLAPILTEGDLVSLFPSTGCPGWVSTIQAPYLKLLPDKASSARL